MATQVYTDQLLVQHALQRTDLGIPPNERWIIRNITWFVAGGNIDGSFQIVEQSTDTTVFWDVISSTLSGSWHHFEDLRIVLLENRDYAFWGGAYPDICVCGYKLTLP